MEIRISSLEGNRQKLDGGAMFGNAPRAVWSKWIEPDEKGRIPLACRCLLIETETEKILCETGIGAFFDPELAERYGVELPERHLLLESLHQYGLSHEDITSVILSHLHFDHAGGLLPTFREIEANGAHLLFPNAEYVVGRKAWERALNPHFRDRASFIPDLVSLLAQSDRLHILEERTNYRDFLNTYSSDGHTPGQLLTAVQGHSLSVVFGGDLVPGVPWIHLPITMGYDRYPELLIDEKQQLYAELDGSNWILFFTHDHQYSGAQIKKDPNGRFKADSVYETFNRMEI